MIQLYIKQILNDFHGFKYFGTYLIQELNVNDLLYLCDFIKIQNYMLKNEWIEPEFTKFTVYSIYDDDINDDYNHNTIGQCINDINYLFDTYLKIDGSSIANITHNIDNHHRSYKNIKLLIDELRNNDKLNGKTELQLLRAIYIEYEFIGYYIYNYLNEESMNKFIVSNECKKWRSSSYQTFE